MAFGQAGEMWLCIDDADCEAQNPSGENVECCSDDKCHPDCAWLVHVTFTSIIVTIHICNNPVVKKP